LHKTIRRAVLKASTKQEVEQLLNQVGNSKTVRKMAEKYRKTQVLSKRDLNILRTLVKKRSQEAA
jgi:hypothetical protein